MKHTLFLIYFAFIPLFSIAQITIEGTVYNKDTNTPIVEALISISNIPSAEELTNEKGEFSLRIPSKFKRDSIIVSFIGFQSISLPVKYFFKRKSSTTIYLSPSPIVLKEVVINGKYDAKAIVENAFARIHKNYPTKAHYLEGFYRKVSYSNDTAVNLVEAAIAIQDKNYRKGFELSYIKIKELRQSDEYAIMDTDFLRKIKKQGTMNPWSLHNLMYKPYQLSLLHIYSSWPYSKQMFFSPQRFFRLDNINIRKSDTLYTISHGWFPPESNKSAEDLDGRNTFTISSKGYGMVEVKSAKTYMINRSSSECTPWGSQILRFEKINGLYYPRFIQHTTHRLINSKPCKNKAHDKITFYFESFSKKNTKKTKFKKPANTVLSIKDNPFPYNPEFWSEYELINKHPLSEKDLNDLERYKPLEEQFQNNGAKSDKKEKSI